MTLSRDEKDLLRQRYETWGLDTVRSELRNPQRADFTSADVDEFAHSWIAEKEMAKSGRSDKLVKFMMVVAGIEFGIMVGQNLSSLLG